MLATLGHYATFLEWAMGDVLVIGFAVWQIISVRRSLRRDRAQDARASLPVSPDDRTVASGQPGAPPPPG